MQQLARRHLATAILDATERNVYTRYAPRPLCRCHGNRDHALLSRYLYRVQNITTNDYNFRLHIETSVDDKYNGVGNKKLSQQMGKLIRIQSIRALYTKNPHKVRISAIGEIDEA